MVGCSFRSAHGSHCKRTTQTGKSLGTTERDVNLFSVWLRGGDDTTEDRKASGPTSPERDRGTLPSSSSSSSSPPGRRGPRSRGPWAAVRASPGIGGAREAKDARLTKHCDPGTRGEGHQRRTDDTVGPLWHVAVGLEPAEVQNSARRESVDQSSDQRVATARETRHRG